VERSREALPLTSRSGQRDPPTRRSSHGGQAAVETSPNGARSCSHRVTRLPMISSMGAQRLVVSALLSFMACASAVAIDWPKTYVVAEETKSPDGKYALIVQNFDAALSGEGPSPDRDAVFLANIPEHKVIGEIKDVDYFERMNSRYLRAQWLDDSSACLVIDGHFLFGVDGVHLVERSGQSIQQTDLTKRIVAINPSDARVNLYFRFQTGPNVVVRAVVPARQLQETKSSAMFRGTFDIPSKSWGAVTVRRVTFKEHEAIESALAADPKEYTVASRKAGEVAADDIARGNEQVYPSEEKRFKALDELLNDVYAADRIFLPAARFSKLKDEQPEWLKQLVAAPTLTDKSKLMQQRIKVLQDLLWQD
jgi:hypothetical protein